MNNADGDGRRLLAFAQIRRGAGEGTRTPNRPITRRTPTSSSGLYVQLQPRRRPHGKPDSPSGDFISHHEPHHATGSADGRIRYAIGAVFSLPTLLLLPAQPPTAPPMCD